jgi:hypothetical protein
MFVNMFSVCNEPFGARPGGREDLPLRLEGHAVLLTEENLCVIMSGFFCQIC